MLAFIDKVWYIHYTKHRSTKKTNVAITLVFCFAETIVFFQTMLQ